MKGFFSFSIFAALSVFIHCLLIFLIWLFSQPTVTPLRGGGGEVSVEIVQPADHSRLTAGGDVKLPQVPEADGRQSTLSHEPRAPQGEQHVASLPSGSGTGPTSSGIGSGPVAGNDAILAEIRARIERAKRYPLLARKSGTEGRSLVRFQIGENGSPTGVNLKSSSGSRILDDEALATIKRAAPYPTYSDPLEIWIRFQLNP